MRVADCRLSTSEEVCRARVEGRGSEEERESGIKFGGRQRIRLQRYGGRLNDVCCIAPKISKIWRDVSGGNGKRPPFLMAVPSVVGRRIIFFRRLILVDVVGALSLSKPLPLSNHVLPSLPRCPSHRHPGDSSSPSISPRSHQEHGHRQRRPYRH